MSKKRKREIYIKNDSKLAENSGDKKKFRFRERKYRIISNQSQYDFLFITIFYNRLTFNTVYLCYHPFILHRAGLWFFVFIIQCYTNTGKDENHSGKLHESYGFA